MNHPFELKKLMSITASELKQEGTIMFNTEKKKLMSKYQTKLD